WLGIEGIAGRLINSKEMLFIKANMPALPTQVGEVADSEDNSEDDVEPALARSLR
ncbi:hypothetical protein CC80DRAFT_401158, partial [Byssothecium circinans]